MIPLRDNVHSRHFPYITVGLIIINFYTFFQEIGMSDAALAGSIQNYGLVPASFLANFDSHPLAVSTYVPLFSDLFLHGGWMHIIGNMWYLWLFGHSVEDCLGRLNFTWFYLLCGIAANLSQIIVDPASTVPTIGASGAISGVLGAYFLLYPRARISTLIPLFIFFPIIQIRAWLFLIFWFLLQLQSGALALFTAGSGIAWWAHIGGFVAGMALVKMVKD
ncbi:MAG: rhomboid family intramembrane serine protease [Negativicutes bacterium]|nr:rhomboid family intramembrane serine protease [Negativicutes bacterium]